MSSTMLCVLRQNINKLTLGQMMLVCHRHLMLSSLSKASRTCLCYLTTFHYCFAPCFLSLTPAVTALAWRTIFLIPKTLQLNKLIFRKTTESWNYQRLENILIEISSEWKGKVFSFPFLTFLFIYSPILCFNSPLTSINPPFSKEMGI